MQAAFRRATGKPPKPYWTDAAAAATEMPTYFRPGLRTRPFLLRPIAARSAAGLMFALLATACASGRWGQYTIESLEDRMIERPLESAAQQEEISLRDSERSTREALDRGAGADDLSLGELTTVDGFTWTGSDILIHGRHAVGGSTPLRRFVEALRIMEKNDTIWMSLDPSDPTALERPHRIVTSTSVLVDTTILESMAMVDYYTKALALGQAESFSPDITSILDVYTKIVMDCDVKDITALSFSSQNMFYVPGPPGARRVRLLEGYRIEIDATPAVLLPGSEVKATELIGFADAVTAALPDLERRPLFREHLFGTYRMLFFAQLLILAAEREPTLNELLAYWLRDFPLGPHLTPRELPGLGPHGVGRVCVRDFRERGRQFELSGGVVVRYHPAAAALAPGPDPGQVDDADFSKLAETGIPDLEQGWYGAVTAGLNQLLALPATDRTLSMPTLGWSGPSGDR